MQALSDQSVKGVLGNQGMTNVCPSSHLAHVSVLPRCMRSCASGHVSSWQQRQSKPLALSMGLGKRLRHSLCLPCSEGQIKRPSDVPGKGMCSSAQLLSYKGSGDSLHSRLQGTVLLLPALDAAGLQWAIVVWPCKSGPVCWLLVTWRLVGWVGLVGFSWCLFFSKAWTFRSADCVSRYFSSELPVVVAIWQGQASTCCGAWIRHPWDLYLSLLENEG